MSVSLSDTPLKKKKKKKKDTLLTILCLVTDKILFDENKKKMFFQRLSMIFISLQTLKVDMHIINLH